MDSRHQYRYGDKVYIRDDFDESWVKEYCFNSCETAMMQYLGARVTIATQEMRRDYGACYRIKEDDGVYFWCEGLLTKDPSEFQMVVEEDELLRIISI